MLLEGYELELVNSACNPEAMAVHCHAHLDQDVSAALPYLNTVLGAFQYVNDPPTATFRSQGKLITVHGRKISITALKDRDEAVKIVEWLRREINDAWDRRGQIAPSYESLPQPQMIEILKLLPKTNCRQCGEPTCMVFATRVREGIKTGDDCPPLDDAARQRLAAYLKPFRLDEIA